MSKGGDRYGNPHMPIESCHSLSAWGYYQEAQMWQTDYDFEIEWTFSEFNARLEFVREGERYTQNVRMVRTRCHFGNFRQWFVCPQCGRRVGKLYLPETIYINGRLARMWKCRHCYRLTYEQRRTRNHYWALTHRAERIADRWLGDMTDPHWIGKQKGQHQRTFERRSAQYEDLHIVANLETMQALGRIMGVDVDLRRPLKK